MKNKFCKVCGYKTYSESKGRPVMCECLWKESEQVDNEVKEKEK